MNSAPLPSNQNFEFYDKVKNASTKWKQEISSAAEELRQRIALKKEPIEKISVTKIVQIDEGDIGKLQAEVNKQDLLNQVYAFRHDGQKSLAVLIVLVPNVVGKEKNVERAAITTTQYNKFIDSVLEEKLLSLCYNRYNGVERFYPETELGYDFSLIKQFLERNRNVTVSKLNQYLRKENIQLEIAESRAVNGVIVSPRPDESTSIKSQIRMVVVKTDAFLD